jgi:hypothetical protein
VAPSGFLLVARMRDGRTAPVRDHAALRVAYALEKHQGVFVSLWRHEEVLTRTMLKMLHELQRLQAMRAGEPVVPPAVLDVNINHDSPENCAS